MAHFSFHTYAHFTVLHRNSSAIVAILSQKMKELPLCYEHSSTLLVWHFFMWMKFRKSWIALNRIVYCILIIKICFFLSVVGVQRYREKKRQPTDVMNTTHSRWQQGWKRKIYVFASTILRPSHTIQCARIFFLLKGIFFSLLLSGKPSPGCFGTREQCGGNKCLQNLGEDQSGECRRKTTTTEWLSGVLFEFCDFSIRWFMNI